MYLISVINVLKCHNKVEKKGMKNKEGKEKGKKKGKEKERRKIFAKSNQNKSWKEFSAIISVMLLL